MFNYYILTSVIFLLAFTSMIVFRYGVLSSISDSWYKLPTKDRWMFPVFLWGLSIPIMIAFQKPLIILGCLCICMVGIYPWFKLKIESSLHSIFAYSGIALNSLSAIIDYHQYIYIIVLVIFEILLELFKAKNKTWWQEVVAIIILLTALSQSIVQ